MAAQVNQHITVTPGMTPNAGAATNISANSSTFNGVQVKITSPAPQAHTTSSGVLAGIKKKVNWIISGFKNIGSMIKAGAHGMVYGISFGMTSGTIAGAVIGGCIGSLCGNPLAGLIVGAGIGSLTGSISGGSAGAVLNAAWTRCNQHSQRIHELEAQLQLLQMRAHV